MAQFLRKLLSGASFLAVIMISLTAVITHGLMISRLGYYHDDWYMLWSGAARGVDSLVPLFSYDQLLAEGLSASDPLEYFVFIEGLVNQGREDEVREIANNAIRENEALRYSVCSALSAAPEKPDLPGYQREKISQIICK